MNPEEQLDNKVLELMSWLISLEAHENVRLVQKLWKERSNFRSGLLYEYGNRHPQDYALKMLESFLEN